MNLFFTKEELKEIARRFWKEMKNNRVFAFHGELGAGKTTFITALCEVMEVVDTPSSPTFSIINEYRTAAGETVFHLDLYRIKDEEEAVQTGIEDCLLGGNTCFIEWAERIPDLLPEGTVHVYLSVEKGGRNLETKRG